MSRKLRIAYMAHSLRSDWNNGNAHFLRGLLREMTFLGHTPVVFEPSSGWSINKLRLEPGGEDSLNQFRDMYPELSIQLYSPADVANPDAWRAPLRHFDLVILHEWNPPELATVLLQLRDELGYRLLFHDTHHRASSAPQHMRLIGIDKFDGVIAFGEALRTIYRNRFGIRHVWTMHEAADTRVFRPIPGQTTKQDVVWVGNWGDDERSQEIREMIVCPARRMPERRFTIYGVRYPDEALRQLNDARIQYGGYLPNLEAPATYAASRATLHVPRQQYVEQMVGIPTIRVFEALACGVPLISAPWRDTEALFRRGDFAVASNGAEMHRTLERLLAHPDEAAEQAECGRETILRRHTCAHRAAELSEICEEVLR